MRIYLDNCCWSRPFDDRGQERVRLEAEAVEAILLQALEGRWELIYSDVVEAENEDNPDASDREDVRRLLQYATRYIEHGEAELDRAAELMRIGLHTDDALHLACAEAARADIFLTTDDRLLRRCLRNAAHLRVRAANPAEWLAEQNP